MAWSTFQAGDEIVISALEHHANLLPWQQLALRRDLKLVVLPAHRRRRDRRRGRRRTDHAAHPIAGGQSVVQRARHLAAAPASLGLAQAQGALTVIDGAQGVVHGRHDVQDIGCDFYVFSSHKLYGPDGVGVLFGRQQALAQLQHWQFGGEMVLQAGYQTARFRPAPLGFEAGTPPISAVIGLGATLDYLTGLNQSAVAEYEAALHDWLLRRA